MPILSIAICVISASVFLIPSLLIMNRLRNHSFRRTFLYYIMSVYLCVVYELVGPPTILYFRWDPEISWIPFGGIMEDVRSNVLNVILFIPLGVFLPLLWRKYKSFGKTIMFGFLISLGIEISQLFTFRATDINDLITNSLGTALGFITVLPIKKKLPLGIDNGAKDEAILLGMSCAIMFLAVPFVSQALYQLI